VKQVIGFSGVKPWSRGAQQGGEWLRA